MLEKLMREGWICSSEGEKEPSHLQFTMVHLWVSSEPASLLKHCTPPVGGILFALWQCKDLMLSLRVPMPRASCSVCAYRIFLPVAGRVAYLQRAASFSTPDGAG